jgi:hypothetical protein
MLESCDSCQNMARVTVHNFTYIRHLCARHAGELCASVGDTAGAAHFTALMEGDRQLVS